MKKAVEQKAQIYPRHRRYFRDARRGGVLSGFQGVWDKMDQVGDSKQTKGRDGKERNKDFSKSDSV